MQMGKSCPTDCAFYLQPVCALCRTEHNTQTIPLSLSSFVSHEKCVSKKQSSITLRKPAPNHSKTLLILSLLARPGAFLHTDPFFSYKPEDSATSCPPTAQARAAVPVPCGGRQEPTPPAASLAFSRVQSTWEVLAHPHTRMAICNKAFKGQGKT